MTDQLDEMVSAYELTAADAELLRKPRGALRGALRSFRRPKLKWLRPPA